MLNLDNLKRVFFHELGHFVANELNSWLWGIPNTKSISITAHPVHIEDFEGETIKNIPPGFPIKKASDVPIDELAPYLASVMYGCVVQAYVTGTTLDYCIGQNGMADIGIRNMALDAHAFHCEKKEFSQVLVSFYEIFKTDPVLDSIVNLPFESFITQIEEGRFMIDLDGLRSELMPFLDKHVEAYKVLVSDYEILIQETLKKIQNEESQHQ